MKTFADFMKTPINVNDEKYRKHRAYQNKKKILACRDSIIKDIDAISGENTKDKIMFNLIKEIIMRNFKALE